MDIDWSHVVLGFVGLLVIRQALGHVKRNTEEDNYIHPLVMADAGVNSGKATYEARGPYAVKS